MRGWDRERRGDYTPAAPPRAFWIAIALLVVAIACLAAFAS